ncbi:MAG: hypothetical protein ACXAAH_06740, partial [Promethearchaeota archaeon]
MKESSIMELREVNRMMYLRPDNGSLVDKRTHKEYNFSNLAYTPGSLGQCIIQSGADGIWGPSSYLKIKIRLVSTAAGDFVLRNGTLATNLIESVRLTHRSGEIIEFIDNYNLLASLLLRWDTDLEDYGKLESMLNADSVLSEAAEFWNAQNLTKKWTTAQVGGAGPFFKEASLVVPMWLLLGCFNNKDQYIPPNFLAGAKLELKFASLATVFSSAILAGGAMSIEPSIVLDSSKFYDSVAAQLLDQQSDVARSGLQFTYSTWFNNSSSTSTKQINVDVQQSASITQKVLCAIRLGENVTDPGGKDTFETGSILSDYQWRLGSTYYPQARVDLSKGQAEAYQQTLIAWDSAPNQYHGHKSEGNCGVRLREFNAAAGANGAVPHYATTLEKSGVGLTLTGEPTNNSRSLNFSASIAPDAADRDVQIYLMYTRIANIMGQNL